MSEVSKKDAHRNEDLEPNSKVTNRNKKREDSWTPNDEVVMEIQETLTEEDKSGDSK